MGQKDAKKVYPNFDFIYKYFQNKEENPSHLVNFSSCSKDILVLKNANGVHYDVIVLH